jgi:hypothetical protein
MAAHPVHIQLTFEERATLERWSAGVARAGAGTRGSGGARGARAVLSRHTTVD